MKIKKKDILGAEIRQDVALIWEGGTNGGDGRLLYLTYLLIVGLIKLATTLVG